MALLLTLTTLNGMQEGDIKALVENGSLTDEQKTEQYIATMTLPEGMDVAIKEDISVYDPQAAEKIERYIEMLIPAFNPASLHATSEEMRLTLSREISETSEILRNLKMEFATMPKQKNGPSLNKFLVGVQKLKGKTDKDYIETWNEVKATVLPTLGKIQQLKPRRED